MTWTQNRNIGVADMTAVEGDTAFSVKNEAWPQSPLSKMQTYLNLIKELYQKLSGTADMQWDDARIIDGFQIREIFSGEEDLTTLLTRYVERIAAVRY